jgi:hypothetical protein
MSRVADRDFLQERINGHAHSPQSALIAGPDESAQETMGVRATYDMGEVRFDLPTSATLAQLLERLETVGHGHGAPVSVEVLIGPALPID